MTTTQTHIDYDEAFVQRSRHSIRINGSFWDVVLANNASYLAEFLQADIASLLELPRSTIYIADMRIGSLICEFIATRNASQIIPDNLINAKLLGARLPDTFALYFDTTGSREPISTTASAVVKSSTDPAGTKTACDSTCLAAVVGGCIAALVVIIIVSFLVVRWRRAQRRRCSQEVDGGESGASPNEPLATADERPSLPWFQQQRRLFAAGPPTSAAISRMDMIKVRPNRELDFVAWHQHHDDGDDEVRAPPFGDTSFDVPFGRTPTSSTTPSSDFESISDAAGIDKKKKTSSSFRAVIPRYSAYDDAVHRHHSFSSRADAGKAAAVDQTYWTIASGETKKKTFLLPNISTSRHSPIRIEDDDFNAPLPRSASVASGAARDYTPTVSDAETHDVSIVEPLEAWGRWANTNKGRRDKSSQQATRSNFHQLQQEEEKMKKSRNESKSVPLLPEGSRAVLPALGPAVAPPQGLLADRDGDGSKRIFFTENLSNISLVNSNSTGESFPERLVRHHHPFAHDEYDDDGGAPSQASARPVDIPLQAPAMQQRVDAAGAGDSPLDENEFNWEYEYVDDFEVPSDAESAAPIAGGGDGVAPAPAREVATAGIVPQAMDFADAVEFYVDEASAADYSDVV